MSKKISFVFWSPVLIAIGVALYTYSQGGRTRDAGRLLREVIRHHLDGRELKSRKVLLDLHRARMPAKPSPEAS